ncbi:MAG: NAD(P)-binding domain-containing protein [Cyclobacteriaceae bacterium]
MKHKIGVIGSGQVARVLAGGFAKHGHSVIIGSRDVQKLNEWKKESKATVNTGSFAEAAAFGDLVLLAVKGTAALQLVKTLAIPLAGKIVLDTTNPISEEPPENGVLKFFTDLNESLMEKLQKAIPAAKFVKTFSSVGSALMVNPKLKDKPTMFICGNDAPSKQIVEALLSELGWETADMGKAEAARAIEPLCILWCIPGFLHNEWSHAFKLLKS